MAISLAARDSGQEGAMFDREKLRELAAARDRWEETTLQQWLARMPERQETFTTVSGEPVNRLYTPLDIPDFDYLRDLGFPGEYPFTRGIHATMYRGRLWTMRLFAGYGTAEETNARFKYLLEHGQTGLSIAFDLPTLYGYDTDDPMAEGEFGKCGVAVSSLLDMEILLDGIPLDQITTSMTINGPAAIIWAMYLAVAEKRGIPWDQIGGTTQTDILKEYIAQKEWIFPPEPSMRLVVDMIEFGSKYVPKWNPISISGYHIREAGATAAQELAFTLADGFEYVRWCLRRGPGHRFLRAPPLVLLQLPQRFLRRDRQVPGRPPDLGPGDAGDLRGQKPALLVAALPHPDRRLHPHRPATLRERDPGGHSGPGRRAGGHSVPSHQLSG
jgi:methylmalonyl-CoA mutase, N-terminal domain